MAQQDTGLGWSAKGEWLTSGNPTIAALNIIGGASYPGQPIPKHMTSAAEIVQAGYHYFDAVNQYYSDECYCAAEGDEDILIADIAPEQIPNWYGFIFISPTENAKVNLAARRSSQPNPIIINTLTLSSRDSVTGLYFATISGGNAGVSQQSYAPLFNTSREALDAVQITQLPYVKLNQGPAVACLAEWYTPEGADLISPVLISTVPDYTVISTDGATPSTDMTTFDFLYQGARFYISIIGGNTDALTSDFPSPDLRQFGASMPVKIFNLIAAESLANIIVGTAPDPYENEAGASTEEGGDGEDIEDDPVEEETMPIPSAAHFCTIYVPTTQELGQMASYLWSGAFDVTQVIKLFSNPMDSILGLSAVPVDLAGVEPPDQIYLGGVALPNVTMHRYAGRTAVPVDCGTVTIAERWGSYLDYTPYTDFSIYLPFIGIKTIKADDIMGKTVSLKYNIDILSGGCVAYLRPVGGSVLYEWSGQCALQIPVTGRSYDNVFQSAMSVATASLAAVTAPASAPVLSGAVASAAVQAAATKPHIERSGAVNGITGFLGQLRPYIIRAIPEAFIPADQNKFIGYPAYINVDLANVRGYNEVDSIHLENVPATGAELDEIETILKGGVIF